MEPKSLFQALFSVTCSVLFAGIFYVGWMAVFITVLGTGSPVLRGAGWLSAPVVTALGFAAGLWIAERLILGRRTSLCRILAWPLVGCAVGAGVLFWFGPMLVVFGMFAAGTASVALNEVVAARTGKE